MGIRKRIGVQSLPYVGLIAGLVLLVWIISFGIGTYFFFHISFTQNVTFGGIGPLSVTLILFGAVFVRSAIFLLAEQHILLEIIGERQYYRWANTFSGTAGANRATIDDSKPLLYQYRPWWLVVVLIMCAIAQIITGLKVQVILWATTTGAALLAETVLRVVLELLWLRTGLGPIGKRLLLRWLPWFSISIRQYWESGLRERGKYD